MTDEAFSGREPCPITAELIARHFETIRRAYAAQAREIEQLKVWCAAQAQEIEQLKAKAAAIEAATK